MLNPLCDAIHYRREFLLFMSNEHCVVPWPVWCALCGTMMCCVVPWCVVLCGTVWCVVLCGTMWYHGGCALPTRKSQTQKRSLCSEWNGFRDVSSSKILKISPTKYRLQYIQTIQKLNLNLTQKKTFSHCDQSLQHPCPVPMNVLWLLTPPCHYLILRSVTVNDPENAQTDQ